MAGVAINTRAMVSLIFFACATVILSGLPQPIKSTRLIAPAPGSECDAPTVPEKSPCFSARPSVPLNTASKAFSSAGKVLRSGSNRINASVLALANVPAAFTVMLSVAILMSRDVLG